MQPGGGSYSCGGHHRASRSRRAAIRAASRSSASGVRSRDLVGAVDSPFARVRKWSRRSNRHAEMAPPFTTLPPSDRSSQVRGSTSGRSPYWHHVAMSVRRAPGDEAFDGRGAGRRQAGLDPVVLPTSSNVVRKLGALSQSSRSRICATAASSPRSSSPRRHRSGLPGGRHVRVRGLDLLGGECHR